MDGLIEFLQARWRTDLLRWTMELADVLLARFQDPAGGFYFTADDHEALIHRPKPLADEAIPSGNGIAAHALARLGHLVGDHRYLTAAERTLKTAWPAMERAPYIHNALLLALEEHLDPGQTIVLRGDPDELADWKERADRACAPRRMVFAIGAGERALPGLLAERRPDGPAVAYICSGMTCLPPVKRFDRLKAHLTATEAVHSRP
jgi:uncharacterized protein YyaL (SSP411 family)